MSSKSEIRLLAEIDPGRVDRMRELEEKVAGGQFARYSERLRVFQENGPDAMGAVDRKALLGDNDKPRPFTRPAWFQSPTKRYGCVPIDEVVAWSKTTRGGKKEDRQENLFGGMNDGCMRWGLCETSPDEEATATDARAKEKG